MKFEDALAKMKLGDKIRHPDLEDDVYFQTCRVGIIFENDPQKSCPISLVKMKGDRQHEDMFNIKNPVSIPIYLLIDDGWEIVDDPNLLIDADQGKL